MHTVLSPAQSIYSQPGTNVYSASHLCRAQRASWRQVFSGCPKPRRTGQQKGAMMNFKLPCNPTLYCHQEKLAKEM